MYKVECKDMFTLKSITERAKETKPEVQIAIRKILELMRMHKITKVETN